MDFSARVDELQQRVAATKAAGQGAAAGPDPEYPRKLLTTAALIMSGFLITSSFATTAVQRRLVCQPAAGGEGDAQVPCGAVSVKAARRRRSASAGRVVRSTLGASGRSAWIASSGSASLTTTNRAARPGSRVSSTWRRNHWLSPSADSPAPAAPATAPGGGEQQRLQQQQPQHPSGGRADGCQPHRLDEFDP